MLAKVERKKIHYVKAVICTVWFFGFFSGKQGGLNISRIKYAEMNVKMIRYIPGSQSGHHCIDGTLIQRLGGMCCHLNPHRNVSGGPLIYLPQFRRTKS